MVIIGNMDKKPEHCADCPICNYYDECQLLPFVMNTWEEQYARCPLVEVEQTEGSER